MFVTVMRRKQDAPEGCVFILSSITYAHKASKLLSLAGIPSSLIKGSDLKKFDGCGYGINVRGDCVRARNIIESGGITIRSETREGRQA